MTDSLSLPSPISSSYKLLDLYPFQLSQHLQIIPCNIIEVEKLISFSDSLPIEIHEIQHSSEYLESFLRSYNFDSEDVGRESRVIAKRIELRERMLKNSNRPQKPRTLVSNLNNRNKIQPMLTITTEFDNFRSNLLTKKITSGESLSVAIQADLKYTVCSKATQT